MMTLVYDDADEVFVCVWAWRIIWMWM